MNEIINKSKYQNINHNNNNNHNNTQTKLPKLTLKTKKTEIKQVEQKKTKNSKESVKIVERIKDSDESFINIIEPPKVEIKKKLPPVKPKDPDRYKKAYVRALNVNKYSNGIPWAWRDYFNQNITPSYSFSYTLHTPQCLIKPQFCTHRGANYDNNTYTPKQIHKHIFGKVNINSYLDFP